MKTLLIAIVLLVSACGSQGSTATVSDLPTDYKALCSGPAKPAVTGQVAVMIIWQTGNALDPYNCDTRDILGADLAVVQIDYSACAIAQASHGYLVDCYAVTSEYNQPPYIEGAHWAPPYAQ